MSGHNYYKLFKIKMAPEEKYCFLALWFITTSCCISGLEGNEYPKKNINPYWSTPGEIPLSDSTQNLLLDLDTKSFIEDPNENNNSTDIASLWSANTTMFFNTSVNTTKKKETCIDELRRSHLPRQYTNLKLACVPFLTIIGITGNILSFIVMGSAVYSRKSYSFYLRALAIFDSLTLITESILVGNELSHKLGSGSFLEGHSLFTCKLTNFLESVVYLMSSWLVVAFTFDRYIAVCHPLQRARLCTETRAKVTILVLLVFAMASQAFRFYYIERLDRHQPCHAAKELRIQYFGVHYLWFSFTLRFALPFLAIVVCNGLIIFHVQRMSKIRQTEERDKKRRANLAITTLVVICTVFILTLVPNAIIALVQYLKGRHKPTFCVLYKFDTPFQMVRLLNYSTNFIMYGLTGRLFRCELRRLLSCRRCRRRGKGASSPSFAHRNRKGLKVNFRSVQRRLPALGGAANGAPCQRLVGNGSRDRRFFLAGQNESKV